MKFFGAAICAAFVLASIPAGAAQPGTYTPYHSHLTRVPHYDPLKANGKTAPHSTIAVNLPSARRSGANSSEIDHLEHQTSSQLLAQSRHGVKSTVVSRSVVHSQARESGSGINFAYRGQGGRSSTSRRR
jgi:hypothetical protein